MRERRLRAEIRDGHGLFERERAGHDFAVNRAQLLVGHRPGVGLADALEHGAFAMRRINLLARREFDVADGEDVARALVEQPDDVRVQLVNRLAMFGNVHGRAECRIKREESNLFRAVKNGNAFYLETIPCVPMENETITSWSIANSTRYLSVT